MKNIDTLSSIDGRKLLFRIFYKLRYEKQLSGLSTLFICWRICVREREIFRITNEDYTVLHPLGLFSGTWLWMEEIVNRHFYSTINSFVYLGAAILLVLIGLRRFSNNINDDVVIIGLAFEATMLLGLFIVMLFTPNNDTEMDKNEEKEEEASVSDLILEVGEISRDFAAVLVQMEKMNESYQDVIKQQNYFITQISKIVENSNNATLPNPQMLDIMKETNVALSDFKSTVSELNRTVDFLKKEEVEQAVRLELERLLINRIPKQSV